MPSMEILVLGDGGYVTAILNAVAGIKGYGTLGAIGALIGLLLTGLNGMTGKDGGRLDIAPILISVVLFYIMFVPRVDRVMVTEVMVQPGNVAPRTFVVDNVPLGLAAAGYAISNLGAKLTMQYETSFGSATDEARGTTGGLGRNLTLLTELRTMLSNPNFTDPPSAGTDGYLGRYRENMTSYLKDCTYPMVNNGVLTQDFILNSPGISGAVNDVTANPVGTMSWRVTGQYQEITCRAAKDRLEADTQNPQLLQAFDQAMKHAGKAGTARDIQGAFGTYAGQTAVDMQTMVATAMLNAVASAAAVRGSLSPAEGQSVIMVEEAAQRRNVQWAAEENMFIRILRPIVGFFEGLFYALGPIMALVVTMGPFGWKLVGKYMMLTIWVGLWFPMLSITQLYSNIQMTYFFDRLGNSGDFYTPLQLTQIASQAQDALGAASALTAATPALAMSLLYGGAVSMSYLAGRLQGSDMIDENKVAPNATQASPVVGIGPGVLGSTANGFAMNGAGGATISSSSMKQQAESYQHQAAQAKTQAFSETMTQLVSKSAGTSSVASAAVSSGWTAQESDAFNKTVQTAREKGQISEEGYTALQEMSQAQKVELVTRASAGLGMPGISPVKASIETAASTGANSQASEKESRQDAAKMSAATKLMQSDAAVASLTKIASHAVMNSVATSSTVGLSESESKALGKAASDAYTASDTYQRSLSNTAGITTNEQLTFSQMSQRFQEVKGRDTDEAMGRIYQKIHSADLEEDYAANLARFQTSGEIASGDVRTQQLAAMYTTLSNANVDDGNVGEVADAYTDLTSTVFNASNPAAAFSGGNAGYEAGGLRSRVEAETGAVDVKERASSLHGPNVAYGAVAGAAHSGIAATQGSVDAGTIQSAPSDGVLDATPTQQKLGTMGNLAVDGAHLDAKAGVLDESAGMIGTAARIAVGGAVAEPKSRD